MVISSGNVLAMISPEDAGGQPRRSWPKLPRSWRSQPSAVAEAELAGAGEAQHVMLATTTRTTRVAIYRGDEDSHGVDDEDRHGDDDEDDDEDDQD